MPRVAWIAEIRARLRIHPDTGWCSHWNDTKSDREGNAAAVPAARSALDAWDDADEAALRSHLPSGIDEPTVQGLRRRTLLRREVNRSATSTKEDLSVVAVTVVLDWASQRRQPLSVRARHLRLHR